MADTLQSLSKITLVFGVVEMQPSVSNIPEVGRLMAAFWAYIRGENQSSSDMIEIVEKRLRLMLVPVITQIRVDDDYYLRHNPDVYEKVKTGEIPSAKHHYVQSGYFEDRFPRPIPIDEPWYLQQYPDVSMAVTQGIFNSARQHFEKDGFREGRLPCDGWSLLEAGDR